MKMLQANEPREQNLQQQQKTNAIAPVRSGKDKMQADTARTLQKCQWMRVGFCKNSVFFLESDTSAALKVKSQRNSQTLPLL